MALLSNAFIGKTVMITGCNRGIGKVAVEKFAAYGADVICCIRRSNDEFTEFAHKLQEKYNTKITELYFDMSDEDSIKEALKPLLKEKRQIDVLINNAGVATGGLLSMTSMTELHDVFQINFFSQVLLTQLVSKLMVRQKGGSIINMGSMAGLENLSGYTSYGSSKAALMFFTKTIARELAAYGIRVNSIAPGLINTEMGSKQEDKSREEVLMRSDMHRLGNPEEIVDMMLFLASDSSSFITGQVYRVDGGM